MVVRYNRQTSVITTDSVLEDFQALEQLLHEINEYERKQDFQHRTQIHIVELKPSTAQFTKTVDLFNCTDVERVRREVEQCSDEFIKVRIGHHVQVQGFLECNRNDTFPECRRRERAKTITEYFV